MNLDDTDESDGDEMKINEADRNIEANGEFHPGFVSEWGDEDIGVEQEENPHETPEKEILNASETGDIDTVRRLLMSDKKLTKATDKDGYTPLHRAAYNNHVEILNLLLEYGADYNAETVDKWTPLHSACHWNSAPCVEKLISLGLNVNAQSQGGITPLHLAASNNQGVETLQALLLHPNIDISIKNNSHETAYEIAIRKGRLGRFFEVCEPCFNYI